MTFTIHTTRQIDNSECLSSADQSVVGWWVDSDVRDAQGGHLLLVELLALVVLPPVCIKYKHKDTSTTVCLGPPWEGGPGGRA